MRWSEATAARWAALVVVAVALAAAAALRGRLAERFHRLKQTSDVYALPSPEQTIVASLGHRAALADALWGMVRVWYGLHAQERRRFEYAGNYLDTINALDPTLRDPYAFADTILTLQGAPPTQDDYRKARQVLERGLDRFPTDAELWTSAGQYLAYLAPPHLKDEKEKAEFRLAGARRLARACELFGKNDRLPYHCVTAAGLFTRAGQHDATIRFLERMLAVTDDENVRALALAHLQKARGEQAAARLTERRTRFEQLWRRDMPSARKDAVLVLGPPFDAARCAGTRRASDPACAATWRAWGAQRAGE